jgi:hypothetical protein
MSQSIDLSAVTNATFNGSAVEQINLNGSGIWTVPASGPSFYVRVPNNPNTFKYLKTSVPEYSPVGNQLHVTWDGSPAQTHYVKGGKYKVGPITVTLSNTSDEVLVNAGIEQNYTGPYSGGWGGGVSYPNTLTSTGGIMVNIPQYASQTSGSISYGYSTEHYDTYLATTDNPTVAGPRPISAQNSTSIPTGIQYIRFLEDSALWNAQQRWSNANETYFNAVSTGQPYDLGVNPQWQTKSHLWNIPETVLGQYVNGVYVAEPDTWEVTTQYIPYLNDYGTITEAHNDWKLWGIYEGRVYLGQIYRTYDLSWIPTEQFLSINATSWWFNKDTFEINERPWNTQVDVPTPVYEYSTIDGQLLWGLTDSSL